MPYSRLPTKPRPGVQLQWAHPLARGLLTRYLFNEGAGTSLFNLVGKNHATLSMDPASDWVGSIHGGALDFDGVDDFGRATATGLDGASAATFTAWFRTATGQTAKSLGAVHNGGASAVALRFEAATTVGFLITAGGLGNTITGTATYADYRWHQLAGTYDGAVMRLYFDGVLLTTGTAETGALVATSILDIARNAAGAYAAAQIDDVRVYNRALQAEEIAWLYGDPYATERFAPWAWYLDRTHAALEVELELNGVGNGWTDVSADLMLNPPPSVDYGIPGAGPLDLTAETGRFSFALNNGQGNSANLLGYYSPGHANVRAGFALGIGVRCRTYANSELRTKFVGKLDFIDPMFGQYRERKTLCMAVDWLDEAAKDSP